MSSLQICNRLIPRVNCRKLRLISGPTRQPASLKYERSRDSWIEVTPVPVSDRTSLAGPMILSVIWSNSSRSTMFPSLGLLRVPLSVFSVLSVVSRIYIPLLKAAVPIRSCGSLALLRIVAKNQRPNERPEVRDVSTRRFRRNRRNQKLARSFCSSFE